MARTSKYSEEIGVAICDAVAAGVPEVHAATAAGIHRDTLNAWKKKYPAFSDAIKRARSDALKRRVERIEQAARGGAEIEVSEKVVKHKDGKIDRTVVRKKTPPQWTADAWYLERQFCEQFGLNRIDLKELIRLLKANKPDVGSSGSK